MRAALHYLSTACLGACLVHSLNLHAFEAGGLNPPKADYQLPPLPELLPKNAPNRIQTPETDEAKANYDNRVAFVLKNVELQGASPEVENALQTAVKAYLGKTVTRLDLDTLRLDLIHQCKTLGLLYPSVLLPSQHIQDGKVRYEIHEGRISNIHIKGAERLKDSYIRSRLQHGENEGLKQDDLQERFQLLLTDPLIERIQARIRPGQQPGDADLELDVTRAKPYEVHLGMDNFTTPTVGAYTGRLDGIVRNLTGLGDFLQINLYGSGGLKGIGGYFSLPLNGYDTRLNLSYQGSEAEVIDSHITDPKIENNFMDITIGLSQPLYRSLNRVFSVEGLYNYRQTHTLSNDSAFPAGWGTEANGKATVSVIRLIQNYLDRSSDRVLSFRSSFNIGIDAFDATINPQGVPDSHFFSWQGQARYLQNLNDNGLQMFFRGDVQLASTNLLPLERFAIGGFNTVRGFRQNEMVRDEGYALSAELRYPLLKVSETQGHQLTLVPFFDLGGAWNINDLPESPSNNYQTLISTGLGLRWSWTVFDADLYWARALSHRPPSGNLDHDLQDDGIYFRVHARLL